LRGFVEWKELCWGCGVIWGEYVQAERMEARRRRAGLRCYARFGWLFVVFDGCFCFVGFFRRYRQDLATVVDVGKAPSALIVMINLAWGSRVSQWLLHVIAGRRIVQLRTVKIRSICSFYWKRRQRAGVHAYIVFMLRERLSLIRGGCCYVCRCCLLHPQM
jgi:hypothetical protein